jgi:hypothetical protein
MAQFWSDGFGVLIGWWSGREDLSAIMIGGPMYSVTINAPDIDTMVPNTFAWLLKLLIATFSILKYIKPKEKWVNT